MEGKSHTKGMSMCKGWTIFFTEHSNQNNTERLYEHAVKYEPWKEDLGCEIST